MLSHLRFHRRAPSNPSSPTPDQISAWEAAAHHDHPQTAQDVTPRPDLHFAPIARVSSRDAAAADSAHHPQDDNNTQSPPARSAFDGISTGFMGGVALQKYRKSMQEPKPHSDPAASATSNQLPENQLSRVKPPPPPINTGLAARPPLLATRPAKSSSFVTPTDLQLGSGSSSGRPSKTRMGTEPILPTTSGASDAPRKGKMPFLKNPMSGLLSRRKTAHHPVEIQPLKPVVNYDPSIRGTRVHDFSAPRKKITPSTDGASVSSSQVETPGFVDTPGARTDPGDSSGVPPIPEGVQVQNSGEPPIRSAEGEWRTTSVRSLPSQDQSVPPVPPKDEPATSVRSLSSATSAETAVPTAARVNSKASTRTGASRAFSISSMAKRTSSVMSAVPKHMKSTSSRFSFDMAGAAKQEKLLEERHRQREQEKKTPEVGSATRDSRFDDFDEDFDYDAMMDDDGFEEKIPGVNADYEEEEDFGVCLDPDNDSMDPDNDQENFSGFVFQRSNPASTVASPHTPGGMMLPTPRDASGKVIGFAMTKDTTPGFPTPVFPDSSALPQVDNVDGSGIHSVPEEAEAVSDSQQATLPSSSEPAEQEPKKPIPDDIYFDDGLADELDFQDDGYKFDESLFDNNDTDQYGRPIPGAFAQAQEALRAAQMQQASKRDSDMTSDLSGQSGAVQSTGHTSLSVQQLGVAPAEKDEVPAQPPIEPQALPQQMMPGPFGGQDLAYQAALAEAAQKAAASGKFVRRGSSPPPPAELTITSPTDSADSGLPSARNLDASLDDYEEQNGFPDDYEDDRGFPDDYENDDFGGIDDDFDFDDEAIIAEANASALANDSDGFYGQEFGFYSAPIAQGGYGHHSNGGNSGQNAELSAENLFSYGGFFGPAGGINRSTSGRVVCREPNLTPITERSEYSNRNSIMSLTLPPAIGNETGARNSMSSPGLAQLVSLMGPDDGMGAVDSSMSLSALMKLRNRAWGGSQASLVSSREGSPRSERGDMLNRAGSPFNGHLHAGNILSGHQRKGSAFSLWSNSDAGGGDQSGAASPALTNPIMAAMPWSPPPMPIPVNGTNGLTSPLSQQQGELFSPVPPVVPGSSPGQQQMMGSGFACSPVLEGDDEENYHDDDYNDNDGEGEAEKTITMKGLAPALPVVEGLPLPHPAQTHDDEQEQQPETRERPKMGHKHKESSESISYTIDNDGDNGKRWVVERRRTNEMNGEVEILGREVVEGGKI
ncbi:hypothetical protein QBC35DRAFT_504438 [Podospora australis]|uniref:AGC-kinase C-terminal domain-containing protein n=1 Tax=Podospora australis TaxID=1536484 RepID=A0AAN7AE22_9PEZI|nr:hypothetical protein QBC35DRAFT_504438 [Podospora australis]